MAKKLELQLIIDTLPSLSNENLLLLKEAVRKEYADRMMKAESDFKLLQNGGK